MQVLRSINDDRNLVQPDMGSQCPQSSCRKFVEISKRIYLVRSQKSYKQGGLANLINMKKNVFIEVSLNWCIFYQIVLELLQTTRLQYQYQYQYPTPIMINKIICGKSLLGKGRVSSSRSTWSHKEVVVHFNTPSEYVKY